MIFSRFRVFTVHTNPKAERPQESAQFVEEGFSLTAFIFSGLWAMYHRLWWPLVIIGAANALIFNFAENGAINEIGQGILQLALNLLVGFMANDWLRARLAREGLVLSDIVTGESLLNAEQRYFDHYYTGQTA